MKVVDKYKPYIYISSTITSAVLLVILLTSQFISTERKLNGFIRKIVASPIIPVKVVKRPSDVITIGGISNNAIYFKTKSSGRLFRTDSELENRSYINLNIGDNFASRFDCFVDSPNVYMLNGNTPSVVHYNLNTKSATQFRIPNTVFSRSAMINHHSFVFRGFEVTNKKVDQILIKGNILTDKLQNGTNIYEKKGDAGISSDGFLHYDSVNNIILHVFFYKNKFTCLDTNLNLLYNATTIDTFSNSLIKADNPLRKANNLIYTNEKPSKFINLNNCVSQGKLYNNSLVISDNEVTNVLASNSVIDIYDLKNGKYEQSFYIPTYKGEKLRFFKVYKDKIIVVYKSYIVLYKLN